MSVHLGCPEGKMLERFLLGDVPPDTAKVLEEHLRQCERCVATMHEMQVGDTFVEQLRRASRLPEMPDDRQLKDSLQRLYGLVHRDAGPEPMTAGHTRLEEDSAEEWSRLTPAEESFSYLDPARGPGELGWLGVYRILRVLGTGGMGIVFAAMDPHLRRDIAVKVLRPRWAEQSVARLRFTHEARAAAALSHDHIVPIFHVAEHRGTPFIIMPLLLGETLADRLTREGRLPIGDVVRIGREIADGLGAAHTQGMVHRDVKPGNIWLETHGQPGAEAPWRVKLLDFGLARLESDLSRVTSTGVILGTPAYMAPEQGRGEKADVRSDLFSLGCVLYHACTGQRPFRGNDTMSTLMSLAVDSPPAPHTVLPDVPQALSDLIMRLLSKDLAHRPASARAVAAELAAIDRDPVRSAGSSYPRAMAWRHRRRALASVVALVLGICGYFLAPTIIRIATNKGELIVEADDPNIEVTINDGATIVHDRVKDRRFVLTAGRYEVEVREEGADGLRFSTKKFTITRGGREVLNARLELTDARTRDPKRSVTPAESSPRPTRWALEFGGTTSYVKIPTLKRPEAGPLTLEIWVRPREYNREQGIFVVAGKTGQTQFNIRWNEWLAIDSGRTGVELTFPATPKETVHLAYVTDGAGGRFFIDGKMVAKVGEPNINYKGRQTHAWFAHPITKFSGVIEEARVSTVARYGIDFVPARRFVLDEHTLALYHFDDGQGDILKDSSGNAHHGQIVGAKWIKVDAAMSDTERRAAEWVLSKGGTLKIDVAGNEREVKALAELPEQPFRVDSVHLQRCVKVTDGDLKNLEALERLRSIDLGYTQVTDAGLSHLRGVSQLQQLAMTGTTVTGAGLRQLPARSLTVLGLAKCPMIDDAAMAVVAGQNDLQILQISDTRVGDAGLVHLKGLNLRGLDMANLPGVTDGGLEVLRHFRDLRSLVLSGNQIGDAGLAHLKELKDLVSLDLRNTKVTAAGVRQLQAALPMCKVGASVPR